MWENAERIISKLASKDEKAAAIFKTVIDNLLRKVAELDEKDNFSDKLRPEIETGIKNSRYSGMINQYPGKYEVGCREICIGIALNQWKSDAKNNPGFKGISEEINDYWHRCSDINSVTIIFTTAWDQVKFEKDYKSTFDSYSSHREKTVAVVLVTPNSISLQYLN